MTDVLDCLKAALADRYTIERQLGAGGTATVYQTEDLKYDREVELGLASPSTFFLLREP